MTNKVKKVLSTPFVKVKQGYDWLCKVELDNLIALLVLCQLLDGILTFIGVNRFGIGQEGNPLLKSLMASFGAGQTLFVVKTLAIVLLFFIRDLYTHSRKHMSFIVPCLHVILIIYTVGAIIPWMIVLCI